MDEIEARQTSAVVSLYGHDIFVDSFSFIACVFMFSSFMFYSSLAERHYGNIKGVLSFGEINMKKLSVSTCSNESGSGKRRQRISAYGREFEVPMPTFYC
jgi:hypothetical protein